MSELVTIASETSLLQANLLRSRLEADGIECFLYGETLASVVGSPSTLANEISIQVRSFDAEHARHILQELNTPCYDEDEDKDGARRKPGVAIQLARILFVGALMLEIAFLIFGVTENWMAGVFAGALVGAVAAALAYQYSARPRRGSRNNHQAH